MDNKIAFALWYGPQYNFGYGIATRNQIHVTWLEKIGLCDLKFSGSLPKMFRTVAKHQGFRTEGLAMTIISEELYETEMSALARRSNQ